MEELISAIKIGKEENITKLLKLGQVHFRPTRFFREIENVSKEQFLRKDYYEGSSLIYKKGRIEFFDDRIRLGYSDKPELLFRDKKDEGYIFSLTSIFEDQIIYNRRNNLPFDRRILKFGDSALILLNPREFMFRISEVLDKNLFNYKFYKVTYLNIDEQNHKYSIFSKPKAYEYQNESRLFINKEESEEFINIEIGSIEDIARQVTIEKLDVIEIENF